MILGIDARVLCYPFRKGIGVYVENLIRAMLQVEPHNQYILYTPEKLEDFRSFTKVINRPISIPAGDSWYLWEQVRLPLELSLHPVDVLHSPANTAPLYKSSPTVVTVHDTKLQEMGFGSRRERLYYHHLQRGAVHGAKRIICPSGYSKQRIIEEFEIADSQIAVVYQGVGSDFRPLSDRKVIAGVIAKYGIAEPYILFAGGESPSKNVSRLIAAFALLTQRNDPGLQLVILGIRTEAIRKQHTTEIQQHGFSGRVQLLNFVEAEDLVALYNGASLFVYPSLSEGFGFPPVEAMACGTPVAASTATSIPEVVGDAAVLFDPLDVNSMADAMRRAFIDGELRSELRAKGFERVKEFSWEQAARRTLDIYRAAVEAKS